MNTHQFGLDIPAAVAASGIGRTKIYEALKTGALPARKFGRRTIVLPDDLDRFLRSLPMKPVEHADAA